MTDNEIDIAIATFMGWTGISLCGDGQLRGSHPPLRAYSIIRNYTMDLNAIHEVELALSETSPGKDKDGNQLKSPRTKYREALCVVTVMSGGPITANATQRSEAVLRSLNLHTTCRS